MPVDDLPDDYYCTLDQLRESLEGGPARAEPFEDEDNLCDWCSRGIPYNRTRRHAFYMADDVIVVNNPKAQQVRNTRRLALAAEYCHECAKQRLLFPCAGYTELRVMADVKPNGTLENVEITDVSAEDDGIPWEPMEVTEALTQMDPMLGYRGPHIWCPENTVTKFLSLAPGCDIREIVNWQGEIQPGPLAEAQEAFSEMAKEMGPKMAKGGPEGRKAFRDHVRETQRSDRD